MKNMHISLTAIPALWALIFTATLATVALSSENAPSSEQMLDALAAADPEGAIDLERDIEFAWGKTGSATRDLLYKQGVEALDRGEAGLAFEHFSALIDHAPDHADAYFQRAIVQLNQERFGPARADLAACLSHEPRHYLAIMALGRLEELLGNARVAAKLFAMGLAIHPHHTALKDASDRIADMIEDTAL